MNYAGLEAYLDSKVTRPLLIWGSPGGGKSSSVIRAAKSRGIHIETLIASTLEPSDIGGIPYRVDNRMEFAPPVFFTRLKPGSILFLDEITTTHPSMQAPLLKLILDKKAGDFQLPEGVRIIAAANPPDQAAGGWELSPPLANRLLHVQWEVSLSEWCVGKYPVVRAFLTSRNSLFAPGLPKEWSPKNYAYPTPRSWETVGEMFANIGLNSELLKGAVGDGAAVEFIRYVEMLDLLDPKEVLENPRLLQTCKKEDSGFASLVGALDEALSRKDDTGYKFALGVGQFRLDWGRYILHETFIRGISTTAPMIALLKDTFQDWKDAVRAEVSK